MTAPMGMGAGGLVANIAKLGPALTTIFKLLGGVGSDAMTGAIFENRYRLTLAARTRLLKTSSLVMDYAVAVAGEIRAEGEAVMVRLTPDGTARAPFSDEARARIIEADRPDIA